MKILMTFVQNFIKCVHVFLRVGADLSDYFNYGFNEDTWKAYCEKQKRLRMGLEVSTVGSVTSKITVRYHCTTAGSVFVFVPQLLAPPASWRSNLYTTYRCLNIIRCPHRKRLTAM